MAGISFEGICSVGGWAIMRFRFLLFYVPFIFSNIFHAVWGYAANLTVMPTSLKLEAPKVAGTVTIRNEGRVPVKMQVRIFRWMQKGGKDVYYPATDVVASPPFVTIKGGADGNIRVARTSQKPLLGLESYRLIIDELPSSRVRRSVQSQHAMVEFVTRQILPVFFSVGTASEKTESSSFLVFYAQAVKGGFNITAVNSGAGFAHIGPVILLAGGKEVGRMDSVAGNVLPKSEFTFFVSAKGGGKPQTIRVLNGKISKEYPLR